MNSLPKLLAKLEQRISTLQGAYLRFALQRSTIRKVDKFVFQTGLVSETWQAWNSFSRSLIITSLQGTSSASGLPVTSSYSANSFDEIRFAAMQVSRGKPVGALKSIAGDRHEPTWGDLKKANTIVSALAPSNHTQVLSAYGSAVLLADLQKVRNVCAHISSDGLDDIRSLQVRYSDNQFSHPSDSIFWVDPYTKDYSWLSWTDEMKLVAKAAVA
jgi:hypothetical protein